MLIINRDDIKNVRPMSNVPYERLDPYLRDAQQFDLKPIIGSAFYLALENDYTPGDVFVDPLYLELLNGKDYTYNGHTIRYSGMKDMMSYFTLSRFIVEQPMNITRYGIVQKPDPNSENLSSASIKMVKEQLMSAAISLRDEMIKFLEQNNTDYPLYGPNSINLNKTGFHFFGV